MVKPSRGGSALGASVVDRVEDLPAAMVAASPTATPRSSRPGSRGPRSRSRSSTWATGPVALPAVEIVPDGGFYDYAARYTAGATEFFAPGPARRRASPQRCAAVALRAHRALGLRDLSRTDLIVDAEGTPWFLEANVAPGMTETSLLPQAVAAAGLDLGAVCRTLVERAAARG